MKVIRLLLVSAMLFLGSIGLNAQTIPTTEEGQSVKKTAPEKEYFDTRVSKTDYQDIVSRLIDEGWDVTVEKDGDMRKISAWRYVPKLFIVAPNQDASSVVEQTNSDGTKTITYRLSEPENGIAVVTQDKQGSLLSFKVYILNSK